MLGLPLRDSMRGKLLAGLSVIAASASKPTVALTRSRNSNRAASGSPLRERPRLIEQLVAGGALVRVRQEHHVGLARVELCHALVARPQADLHGQSRLARQRADQVDVEALRLSGIVEVLVGRELPADCNRASVE